jgi:hypothetical protein
MKKRRSTTKRAPRQLKNFERLSTYMAVVAKGTMHRHKLFSLCVKASACKCFEFNLAVPAIARGKRAFFAMSSLRGICEDLIVLRFIGRVPSKDREELIAALSQHELGTRLKLQDVFFTAIRPQQLVLRHKDVDSVVASSGAAARSIWNRHGWKNLQNGAIPPIRQIAERQGLHQLAVMTIYHYCPVKRRVDSTGWG